MKIIERVIEKNYDLIDKTYFKNTMYSPRFQVAQYIFEKYGNRPVAILDMCSGTGENLVKIAEKNKCSDMIGVDLSRYYVDKSTLKVRKQNMENVRFSVMDASNTSFQDKSFDIIIISLVLHELSEKYAKRIMREARRLIKDGGEVIITEWEEPKRLREKFLFRFVKLIEPRNFKKFIEVEIYKLFMSQNLKIIHHFHCSYTQIFVLNSTEV